MTSPAIRRIQDFAGQISFDIRTLRENVDPFVETVKTFKASDAEPYGQRYIDRVRDLVKQVCLDLTSLKADHDHWIEQLQNVNWQFDPPAGQTPASTDTAPQTDGPPSDNPLPQDV